MTRYCRIAAAVALALALPAAMLAAADETERVNRVIPFAAGGTLKLKNFSGSVRITGGDRDEIAITAVRRAPRERLDRVKLDIQTSATLVTIDANRKESWSFGWDSHNNVVETEFEIQVPARTNLEVKVFESPVTVTAVSGSHHVHAFSGELRLHEVAGAITARTFSGDIEIAEAGWKDGQDLDVHTFSGDIVVRLPETARAKVNFNSFSGDLSSDLPLMLRSKSRGRVVADLNGGSEAAGDVRFRTFSGDVRIKR